MLPLQSIKVNTFILKTAFWSVTLPTNQCQCVYRLHAPPRFKRNVWKLTFHDTKLS